MTIQEAKRIPLADWLHSLGFTPVKRQGANLWYLSPLRREREASFKVNLSRNAWYDFGEGKGGDIIDLAGELFGSISVAESLRRIAGQSLAVCPLPQPLPLPHSESFQNLQAVPLTSPALLSYLQERGIPADTATKECRELHYVVRGKHCFAIGFPNTLGGYEVRNRYFKGCISPKAFTLIRQSEPQARCCVFEGFMDYLSYLTFRRQRHSGCPGLDRQDYLVLNSVTTLSRAMEALEGYERIACMFDNDEAGRKATARLVEHFPAQTSDHSVHYREYKDLNDCLCRRENTLAGERYSFASVKGQELCRSEKQNGANKETWNM
ncbi:MAG: toprim domain-containing protein [Tannerellaceae bacterium]|jgi:hypothetical protein|nr:toprim domain-containing protein [Tannerellaceae bacterium]